MYFVLGTWEALLMSLGVVKFQIKSGSFLNLSFDQSSSLKCVVGSVNLYLNSK